MERMDINMGVSKNELLEALDTIAPLRLDEDWDNSGIQIDVGNDKVDKVLISLDITKDVVDEAIRENVDFIVSHHPLFFNNLKKIYYNNIIGNNTIKLIGNNISVYSAHTTFDKAEKGNNYYLAKLLKLEEQKNLEEFKMGAIGAQGVWNEPKSLVDILEDLSVKLRVNKTHLRVVSDLDLNKDGKTKKFSNVALCTGAGISEIEAGIKAGCDIFITGDVKYHDGLSYREQGITIVDAGHFGTEHIFIENMAAQLKDIFGDKLEIVNSISDLDPFQVL